MCNKKSFFCANGETVEETDDIVGERNVCEKEIKKRDVGNILERVREMLNVRQR